MAYPAAYKKAKKKATAKKKTVTRKKRVVKKKRTAKQIAATKRLVAANKKRVGTSQTKKSMTTKKPPTKRLKKRRASNVKAGYYPNPRKKRYVLCVVPSVAGLNKGIKPNQTGYWTGTGWDTLKSKAILYPTLDAARNEAAHLPKKYRSGMYWSYATETV